MKDELIRAIAADGGIRAFAATTRELTEQARQLHNTSPVATAALGRLLTAGAMMGSMMKGERDLLTLQINGDGPLGRVVVTADAQARVKGYVEHPFVINPVTPTGKLDVGGAIGNGQLSVLRDLGLKEPYCGTTELITGEIAEDLTYYFATSEQTPSAVGLGVLIHPDNTVEQAGGFLIQLLPSASESVTAALEERLAKVTSVTDFFAKGATAEELLLRLLAGLSPEVTARMTPRFECGCSVERVERSITSLGKQELDEMISEGKPIEIVCHFCGKRYTVSLSHLLQLRQAADM